MILWVVRLESVQSDRRNVPGILSYRNIPHSKSVWWGENDLWYRGLGAHCVLTLLGPGLNYKGLVALRKVVFQFILTSDMTLVWTFLDDIPGDVMWPHFAHQEISQAALFTSLAVWSLIELRRVSDTLWPVATHHTTLHTSHSTSDQNKTFK